MTTPWSCPRTASGWNSGRTAATRSLRLATNPRKQRIWKFPNWPSKWAFPPRPPRPKSWRNTLRTEKEQLTLSAITQAVEAGIEQKRIPADKKDHFIALGKTAGLETLKTTIAAMTPAQKVTAVLNRGVAVETPGSYRKLSEVPADKLEALRKEDRETYIALFKAEYGFAPSFKEEE